MNILPGAVVCQVTAIAGDVTIGARTVVHPQATIIAETGPIIIGENNLIEEQSVIINRLESDTESGKTRAMIIGNNNTFEVGCHVEALQIGDNNVIQVKSKVGRDVCISNGVIIGCRCILESKEVIPDNTVILANQSRRTHFQRPASPTAENEFLTQALPLHHYLRKQPGKK